MRKAVKPEVDYHSVEIGAETEGDQGLCGSQSIAKEKVEDPLNRKIKS